MAHTTDETPRYAPANTNAGWPIAAGVILLAILCIAGATYLHKTTYKHPTDPSWHAVGSQKAAH